MIEDGHPQSEDFSQKIDEIMTMWDDLKNVIEKREERLGQSEVAQQVSISIVASHYEVLWHQNKSK
jgi:hypothetical protein